MNARLPPVHFFAEGDVDPGGDVSTRSEALSNRTGRPIDIHEIRFAAIPIQSAFTELIGVDAGGVIRVRLSVDGRPITSTFMPLWLNGRTDQKFYTPSDIGEGGGSYTKASSQVTVANEGGSMFSWRLSRPWRLPPKSTIEAQFQHASGVRFSVRCSIGIAGRYANDRVTTTAIPYAASYVSKSFAYTAADGSGFDFDESSERDLINMTNRKVTIEKIVAKIGTSRATAGAATSFFDDVNSVGAARATQLRIHTSKNVPILRDYASVRAVFGESGVIETNFDLDPGDFLRVGVRNADGPATNPYTTYSAQAYVSMIGHRMEAI